MSAGGLLPYSMGCQLHQHCSFHCHPHGLFLVLCILPLPSKFLPSNLPFAPFLSLSLPEPLPFHFPSLLSLSFSPVDVASVLGWRPSLALLLNRPWVEDQSTLQRVFDALSWGLIVGSNGRAQSPQCGLKGHASSPLHCFVADVTSSPVWSGPHTFLQAPSAMSASLTLPRVAWPFPWLDAARAARLGDAGAPAILSDYLGATTTLQRSGAQQTDPSFHL